MYEDAYGSVSETTETTFDKAQNAGFCPTPRFIFILEQGIFNIVVIIRLDRIIQSLVCLDSPIKSWNDKIRNKIRKLIFSDNPFYPIEGFQVKRETERKESG